MPKGSLQSKHSDKIKVLIICIALAAVTFVAFEGVRDNDFVNYDDDDYVKDNVWVQRGLNAESIKWAFTAFHAGNWHPLTWISHIIDCTAFGLNPGRHHLVSVGFHIANAVLLFLILKWMTGSLWPSAFVAGVFGLHPLAVESVAWIAERKDVLSMFFALLTIAAYFRWTQRPSIRKYLLVMILFAAGLLSKPMVVTLPFVLILLDYWPIGRLKDKGGWRKVWALVAEKLPLLAMSAASAVVTCIAQAKAQAIADIIIAPLSVRAANAMVSYIKYIGKIFYPASLAVLYPRDLKGPALWQAAVCLVLLLAVAVIVIIARRKRRFLLTGWLWYLGTLVPVIGLVQVGSQAMADRYIYLPGIGIYIIVAWLAAELSVKLHLPKIVPSVVGIFVLAVLFLITKTQVEYWKDSLSLCGRALAVTKDNYIMNNNCGEFLRTSGRVDEAIPYFRRALDINPLHASAHNNLGCALRTKGLTNEASAEFEEALRIKPDYATAHNNYGVTLAEQKRYDEAIEQFSKALAAEPYYTGAMNNLCRAGFESGKLDTVLEVLRKLEQETPDNADLYYNKGMIYGLLGNDEKGVELLETALKIAGRQGRKELAEQIKAQLEQYRRTKQGKQ